MIENQPVEQANPVPSKTLRTILQVPLMLIAAAGLGFAGQQMWQNQGDVSKIFHNSQGEFQCPIAAMFGCGSTTAGCSSGGCGSTAAATACASAMIEAGLSNEGCTAGDDCCAAMLRAAEAAASEAPVSALTPVNLDGVL